MRGDCLPAPSYSISKKTSDWTTKTAKSCTDEVDITSPWPDIPNRYDVCNRVLVSLLISTGFQDLTCDYYRYKSRHTSPTDPGDNTAKDDLGEGTGCTAKDVLGTFLRLQ